MFLRVADRHGHHTGRCRVRLGAGRHTRGWPLAHLNRRRHAQCYWPRRQRQHHHQTTLSGTLSIGDGGTLINQGTASGVDLSGAATLDNQGIIGSGNTSVDFTGSGGRLIEHASASINGSVIGNAQSTLELFGTYQLTQRYSGVDGSTYFVQIYNGVSGIGGLGTQITNFGTITVDQGQAWELTGSNTIDSGVSLVNNGLLIVDNPLLVRGTVINNGHAGNYATYLYTGSDSAATQVSGGITVDVGGSLTNNGVLGGHHDGDGVTLTGGSLTNAQGASIEGNSYGVAIAGSGVIRNAGSISIPSGYYQNSQGNYHLQGIAPVGITNTIQSGDTVSGYGLINTINGDNNGVIRASGGTLEIAAAVTGTGRLEIAANSTLRRDAADQVDRQTQLCGSFHPWPQGCSAHLLRNRISGRQGTYTRSLGFTASRDLSRRPPHRGEGSDQRHLDLSGRCRGRSLILSHRTRNP